MINNMEFIPIHNYPIYELSMDGTVRNSITGKILKPNLHHQGYYNIWLRNGRCKKVVLIHRLIAEHFIPNPDGKPFINHIDGNKTNNTISNLEWCTSSENAIHARRLGMCADNRGSRNAAAKLTENQVLNIKCLLKMKMLMKDIAKLYNIGITQISYIKLGKSWKHVE